MSKNDVRRWGPPLVGNCHHCQAQERMEEFILVPVAKQDYAKLNEFAEAAAIQRNPEKAKEIQELRKKMADEANVHNMHLRSAGSVDDRAM